MRINSITNANQNNCNHKQVNFGTDKAVYLCSSLASGFKPTKEILTEMALIKAKRAFIESNMSKAIGYAKKIVKKGDYPFWNHSTWPKFLDDTKDEQRTIAMNGCIDLVKRCDLLVYHKKPKGGMVEEINLAKKLGMPVLAASKYLKMSKASIDKLVESSPRYKKRMELDLC